MRRGRRIALGVSMIVFAVPVAASAASSAARVNVVRCPTTFGITPGHVSVPATVAVRGAPRSVRYLVAYSNTVDFLIGPAHMKCSGAVGADGSSGLMAWPRGSKPPRQHSHGNGLTLQVIPSCVGCMAAVSCPFFPAFAAKLGFRCTSGIPSGETVSRPNSHTARFVDPAGVAGDGFPSGGPDPANGVVGIKGRDGEAYTATCTLPSSDHALCTVTLNDAIARYG